MLSTPLDDQKNIEDFIEHKSDREIAVLSLAFIDAHDRKCDARWSKVDNALRSILIVVGLILLDIVLDAAFSKHINEILHDYLIKFVG
jgi:hypothetical protein